MNTGLFTLGLILLVLGIFSDLFNYQEPLAWPFMIAGFVLLIIGALVPSVVTSTVKRETSIPTSERRTKTVVTEE